MEHNLSNILTYRVFTGKLRKESYVKGDYIPEGTRRKEPSGDHASLLKKEGNVSS